MRLPRNSTSGLISRDNDNLAKIDDVPYVHGGLEVRF